MLRIGGDSTDHTWWPLPGVIEPAGVSYALTPDWLATVHRAAARLHARLILGIDLAAGSSALAGAEARALIGGVGARYIDALEIGNEPDAYTAFSWYRTRTHQLRFARGPGWSEAAFTREFARWAAVLPDVPLAGPAEADVPWMSQLGALISSEPHLGVVTFHRYPLRGCGAQDSGRLAATIPDMLRPRSSTGLAESVAGFVAIAHKAGRPLRIDELNSASCGGTGGVSNTFASSLWIIDTLFSLASAGVDGVNIHTLPGAAYAPFAFRHTRGVWHGTVNPLYYGLLMFTCAFPAGAHLLRTRSSRSSVRVWSTIDSAGVIRTAIVNQAPRPAAVALDIPGDRAHGASVEALTAPGLRSRTGVELGGASFAPGTTTGRLPRSRTVGLTVSGRGHVTDTVPADSAVLITSAT